MGSPVVTDDTVSQERTTAAGGLKPSRAIGGSLNALVRATALYRKGVERFQIADSGGAQETQKKVADRAARAWRAAQLSPLEVDATAITVDGDLALQGDNDYAAWVLYAFMAGVRRITPKRAMTTNDVIRLVSALVALKPTAQSIEHFRNWLDADGAEGFDVRVHTSFREVMEEVDLEEDREFAKAFSVARFEVPRAGDAVYVAARDLDRVAMRREFEVPIEMYAHAASGAGGLSEQDMAAIGQHVNDANAWATAELYTVLSVPALRSAVTPEHMARRVVTRLSDEADERFLMLLTQLNQRGDAFKQAVADALATEEVGEIIARQLRLERPETVDALGRFLALSPEGLSQAVIAGVLGRAVDDRSAARALHTLAQVDGATRVCQWVRPQWLDEHTATVLGKVLSRTRGAPRELTHIVQSSPSEVSLPLLQQLSPELLGPLGNALRFLLGRTQGEAHEAAAALAIAGRDPRNLKLLGDRLLEGKLGAFSGKTLYALCVALVGEGLGESHVLPLASDRGAPEKMRLIALDCIGHDADLVAAVTRFRFSKLLESSAIRKRLRDIASGARKGAAS